MSCSYLLNIKEELHELIFSKGFELWNRQRKIDEFSSLKLAEKLRLTKMNTGRDILQNIIESVENIVQILLVNIMK